MRPDPQTRGMVLMLAGVLILLALSLVAGEIMQQTNARPPPTTASRAPVTPSPTNPPIPRLVAPPTVTSASAASTPAPPAEPSATAVHPTRTSSPSMEPSATAVPPTIPPPAEPSATAVPPTPTALPPVEPSATAVPPTSTALPPVEPSATAVPPSPTTAPPPPPPTPAAGGIPHPTGAHEIVIQMTETAGLLPRLDALAARFPAFTLFGDGTLVYHTRTGYYQTHLDEGAMQGLLTLAITDLHFFDLDPAYPLPNIYDAATTQVRLVAAGQDHGSGASALGFGPADQQATPETPRARLLRLVTALRARMPEGGPPYPPTAVALYAEGGSPLVPADAAADWPLPNTALAAVLEASNRGTGAALRLTGPEAAAALQAAATPRPFREAGRRYTVVAVPDGP